MVNDGLATMQLAANAGRREALRENQGVVLVDVS